MPRPVPCFVRRLSYYCIFGISIDLKHKFSNDKEAVTIADRQPGPEF